jgi:hypothetical protein
MILKLKYLILLSTTLVSCAFAQEERLELGIDEKLTLEDVFAAGFRPSSVYPSDDGDVRVWERQKVTLVFGDFRYDIDTEDITFGLYDDDQISKLRVTTTREMPLSVEEATSEVKKFGKGVNFDATEHIERWKQKCEVRGSMAMESFGGKEWREGVLVLGEFLTTLQPLDKYPAVLAFEIHWDYRGIDTRGPSALKGKRRLPVVSPPGFDWDMSFEAWRERVRAGKAGNRETNIPVERLGIKLPENLPEIQTIESEPSPPKTGVSEVKPEN